MRPGELWINYQAIQPLPVTHLIRRDMDAWRLSHSTNRTVDAVHLCDERAVFWYDLVVGWDELPVTRKAVFSKEN
jgi:hypothetical protein